jgi:hypothetical protein
MTMCLLAPLGGFWKRVPSFWISVDDFNLKNAPRDAVNDLLDMVKREVKLYGGCELVFFKEMASWC